MKRHMETVKHKRGLESLATQPGVANVMAAGQKRTTTAEKTIKADVLFVKFVADHNLSFWAAKHFGKLVQVMFTTAASFSCSHTKTAAVNHAMASELNEAVFAACCTQLFTILCYGGNDDLD